METIKLLSVLLLYLNEMLVNQDIPLFINNSLPSRLRDNYRNAISQFFFAGDFSEKEPTCNRLLFHWHHKIILKPPYFMGILEEINCAPFCESTCRTNILLHRVKRKQSYLAKDRTE